MTDLAPLLFGAALVGVIHMSAPDHWVTLCLLGKSAKWSNRKLFAVSFVTATGHSLLSAALGLAIAAIGFAFSIVVSLYLSLGIGVIMLAAGLFIGVRSLLSKSKREVTPEEKLTRQEEKIKKFNGLGYFAILGAALSPDLSITPVFLAGVPSGLIVAFYLFVVFVVSSIVCQLILVQAGARGLAKTFEHVPEKYNDTIVGFVIAAIGVFIIITSW